MAEKILDIDDDGCINNIGAFVINDDTDRYIENVFSALAMTWNYVPDGKLLELYREHYRKYYDSDMMTLYDVAVKLNKRNLSPFSTMKVWNPCCRSAHLLRRPYSAKMPAFGIFG